MSTEEFYERYIKEELNDYLNRYFVKVCGEYLALLNAQGQLAVQAVKMGVWIGKKEPLISLHRIPCGRISWQSATGQSRN